MRTLIAFGCSALVMAALDFVWLTTMTPRLYKPVLGDWLAPRPNMVAAVAFYFIFLIGITVLATLPALEKGSMTKAAINAAVFGFCCYATYDLTNQATLARWSTSLTLIDLAWGTFISVVAALAGYWGARTFAS